MENSLVLKPLPNYPGQFNALHIAGAGHDEPQGQQRRAQQSLQRVRVNRALIAGVVSQLTLRDLHIPKLINFRNNGIHGVLIAGAGEPEPHGHDAAAHNVDINGGDGAEVDLVDVVNQIVPLIDLLDGLFVNELDELGNLVVNVLLRVLNGVPHDEVLGERLEQNVVGVAGLDHGEAVGNGDPGLHLRVVGFEVNEREGDEAGGRGDVHVDGVALANGGALGVLRDLVVGDAQGRVHDLAALDEADEPLLEQQVLDVGVVAADGEVREPEGVARGQREALAVQALVVERLAADLGQRYLRDLAVAGALAQQAQAHQGRRLHVQVDLHVQHGRQQRGDVDAQRLLRHLVRLPDARRRQPQQDAHRRRLERVLQVLVDVRRRERLQVAQQAQRQQEAPVLVFRHVRLLVEDPRSQVVGVKLQRVFRQFQPRGHAVVELRPEQHLLLLFLLLVQGYLRVNGFKVRVCRWA
jgi:hypothetical protein